MELVGWVWFGGLDCRSMAGGRERREESRVQCVGSVCSWRVRFGGIGDFAIFRSLVGSLWRTRDVVMITPSSAEDPGKWYE